MLGSASAVMVCVLAAAAAVDVVQGTAGITATPVGEEGKASAIRRTIYLFPGTKTLTTLEVVRVKSTSYASCLATRPGLPPCSALATARYYVATPLALDPTSAISETGTPPYKYYSGDVVDGNNRGIPFDIPAVLPVKHEIVTFTSAIVTSTVTHPSITATIQIDGCDPPELPFKAEFCPPPPPEHTTDTATTAAATDATTAAGTEAATTTAATEAPTIAAGIEAPIIPDPGTFPPPFPTMVPPL